MFVRPAAAIYRSFSPPLNYSKAFEAVQPVRDIRSDSYTAVALQTLIASIGIYNELDIGLLAIWDRVFFRCLESDTRACILPCASKTSRDVRQKDMIFQKITSGTPWACADAVV